MELLASFPNPADLFELRSSRLALAELLLLAIPGGLLGTWVVLRRMAFFAHAAGTATFPGLVVAEATSFSPRLAALAVGLGYAGGVDRAARGGRFPGDTATGLVLVASLAIGTILASDLLESGMAVDGLLFGTAIALDGTDIGFSGVAAVLAGAGSLVFGRTWAASSFDPDGNPAPPSATPLANLALLCLVAVAVVASLPAVGALLVASIFAVPSAVARLFARSVRTLALGAVAIAAVLGPLGLLLSVWLDVPPGPAVALLGALTYGACALGTRA